MTACAILFQLASKIISTCAMRIDLKGLALNSCVALKETLISDANQKKRLRLLGSIKIGLQSNEGRSYDLLSPDSPQSRVLGALGLVERQMKWCRTSCWLPTGHGGGGMHWSGVAAVAQVQVFLCQKKEVNWLPEDSEWPAYSIQVFFFPDDTGMFQKDNFWIRQAQIVKECLTLNLSENLWDVLGKLGPMFQLLDKILGTVQKLMEAIPQQ